MNKVIVVIIATVLLIGCSGKEQLPDNAKKVEVTFSFVLPQSGSLSKASAAEVYDSFYNSFVKTGQVLPDVYYLSIKTMDGIEVASVSGYWSEHKPVMLPTGKYLVSGYSKGGKSSSDCYNKAPLLFEEQIEITENTTSIFLHAMYDCYLLLFDSDGKTRFSWTLDGSSGAEISGSVNTAGNQYYIFVQGGFKDSGNVRWTYGGKETVIWMSTFSFEKGYYYYFNDLEGSFEIPKMQPGSI